MKRFLFILLTSAAFACTDFVVQTQDGNWINGRSLEFALDLQSTLKPFARGQKRVSQDPQNKPSVHWTTKYGYLGITPLGKDFSFDGMNEAGLSFGYLWLPGYTEYPALSPQDMDRALDFIDFGDWTLGQFATIAELKEALKKVRIWAHPVPPLGLPPVHAAFHDAQGNHLVVEFIRGEMKVYDNPISVLTNSPPFDWQTTNLQNYLHLDPYNAEPTTFRGKKIEFQGQGSGLLGLPGDWTPASRFVRTFTLLRFAKPTQNAADGVNLAEHLLNAVDIPLGEVREKGKDAGDYTQWVVIKDLKNKVFYFRSYKDLSLKRIDMKKLDFQSSKNRSLPLDTSQGYLDVTHKLKASSGMAVWGPGTAKE